MQYTLFIKHLTLPAKNGWIFLICVVPFLVLAFCAFSALCFPSSGRHILSYRCQPQWGMQAQQESTPPHSPEHTHIHTPIPPIQSHKQHHSALCSLTPWEPNADIHCGSDARKVPGKKQSTSDRTCPHPPRHGTGSTKLYLNHCVIHLKESELPQEQIWFVLLFVFYVLGLFVFIRALWRCSHMNNISAKFNWQ